MSVVSPASFAPGSRLLVGSITVAEPSFAYAVFGEKIIAICGNRVHHLRSSVQFCAPILRRVCAKRFGLARTRTGGSILLLVSDPRDRNDPARIRDRIDAIRLLAGVSRDELADRLGVNRGTFASYLYGRRAWPSGLPERAAVACGVPGWLVEPLLWGSWCDVDVAVSEEAAARAKLVDDVIAARVRRRQREIADAPPLILNAETPSPL